MRKEFMISETTLYIRMDNKEYCPLTDFNIKEAYAVKHLYEERRFFPTHSSKLLLVIDAGLSTEQVIETSVDELLSLCGNKRILNNVPKKLRELVLATYIYDSDEINRHTIILKEDGTLKMKRRSSKTEWEEKETVSATA